MMTRKHQLIGIILVLALLASAVALPVAAQQAEMPILVVNTGALNVRSGPGPQYSVITRVVGGTELPVLGTNAAGTWDLVVTPVGNGWVDISFTLPRGEFRFVPVVSVGAAAIQVAPGVQATAAPVSSNAPAPELEAPEFVVNTGRLNVRSGPGAGFSRIGSVPGGTVLYGLATNTNGSWVLVESPIGRGWIDPQFTLIRGAFSNMPVLAN
jgi:uncharacterized protein YgiM (DUF1202 family)